MHMKTCIKLDIPVLYLLHLNIWSKALFSFSYLQLLQQGLPLLVDLINKRENRNFNLVLHLLVSLGQLFHPGLWRKKKCFHSTMFPSVNDYLAETAEGRGGNPCRCAKGWGCSPALHLSEAVMDIVLLVLQFGHAALNDAFVLLKSLLQKLVSRRERLTQLGIDISQVERF